MAVQFLTGLDVQGNIDLNVNQLQNVVIQPLGADPTGTAGRIYYNSGTNKLRLYDGTQWVELTTGADDDTTYDLEGVGSTNGSAGIRLKGSDNTNDDVLIVGSGTTTVTRSSNTLTVTSNDQFDGTVTSVSGGTGITITGSASITPTVNIDYTGSDNAILAATTATPVGADTIWFSDATDSTIKKSIISDLPGFGADGTVTSVGFTEGALIDLSGTNPITSSGTITIDVDLNELATSTSNADGDFFAVVDSAGAQRKLTKANINLSGFNNDLSVVTSVGITETGSALTITNSPITSSGNINIAGAGNNAQVILGNLTLGTYTTGTVTNIATGAGLTGGPISSTGTIAVDYSATGIIDDAPGLSGSVESDDKILIADDSAAGIVVNASIVDIPLDVLGTPNNSVSFASQKLVSVANGTASTDGVNLGQVQSLVAGVGVFQGGYDATNNPGTPNISGASNVALTTGDFYVVTADGDITFSDTTVTVEVGDLIFANSDITASSNPASTDYTIVIQDQNIAGVGATDGATEKGVAGFSSASFAGTASGFITIKAGGISDAQLASTFNKIIGTDTDLDTDGVDVVDQINVTDGVITSMSKRTLPNATTTAVGVTEIATQAEVDAGTDNFRYVTPLTLKTAVGKQAFSGTYPATSTNSWTITAATHGLGATQGPFVIQTYISGVQVYMDVAIASNGTITFTTTNNQAVNAVVCNIMKVN